ncbi:MAG: YeeE/YedE family protein [bacterium]|tara:strand:+ start:1039 stop:1461 length:423 start_codon:yes stop_codon:yes gene_type:complete
MTEFEVLMPLTGGILIGIAASMMLLFSGKIAGVSGIFGGMLFQQGEERAWKLSFIAGLIAGGILLYILNAEFFENTSGRDLIALTVAGLLVGIGTRVGGGCTSGHGVCGIGRLSGRSIVATVTFVFAGMVVVAFIQSFYH